MITIKGLNYSCPGFDRLLEYLKDRGHEYTRYSSPEDGQIDIEIRLDYVSYTPMIWAILHSLGREDYTYILIE